MGRKFFFGWDNIKWFFTEIGKIYSGKSSFFSKKRVEGWLFRQNTTTRWLIYYGFILTIIGLGEFGNQQFIYFQF